MSLCRILVALLLGFSPCVFAAQGKIIKVNGNHAVVQFDGPVNPGEWVTTDSSTGNSGKVQRVKGTRAAVIFVSPPALNQTVHTNVETQADEPHAYVLGFYSLQDGFNVQIPLSRFSAGLSYGSRKTTDSDDGSSINGTFGAFQIKGGFWLSGIGKTSLYFLLGGGTATVKFSGSVAASGQVAAVTDSAKATYFTGDLGYLWYWRHLNIGVGLYIMQVSLAGSTATFTFNGTQTAAIPSYSSSAVGGDIKIGCTF